MYIHTYRLCIHPEYQTLLRNEVITVLTETGETDILNHPNKHGIHIYTCVYIPLYIYTIIYHIYVLFNACILILLH